MTFYLDPRLGLLGDTGVSGLPQHKDNFTLSSGMSCCREVFSFTQRYGATYRTTWIFNKTAVIASNVAGTNLPVCQNGMLSANSRPLLEVTVSCQDSAQRTGVRLWAKQGIKCDNNILF